MPVPRVAIVGRPNVGKSSLLNMIAREKIAIVDAEPGVTRDRLSIVVDLEPPLERDDPGAPERRIELTDTGGFGVYVAEGKRYNEIGEDLSTLTADIERQIAGAVSTADLILFAVDVQAGITAADLEIARMLREQKLGRPEGGGKTPVRVVGTKVDGEGWEPHAYELAGLGFGEPLMCSAKSNYMRRQLLDRLYEIVPEGAEDDHELDPGLRIAVLGKRNSGKSTLINRLAGRERVIVSEIAGTTRDAIDVRLDLPDGRRITAIDTAGLRRKKSFQDRIEWFAFDRAQRAIERCDVALLMLDAQEEVSQVDEKLAQLLRESYKPVVIVVNKWDVAGGRMGVRGKRVGPEDFDGYIRRELKGLDFAPIAIMSAKDGTNVDETISLAFEMHEQASTRIGTGELNRIVREITERQTPSNKSGEHGRIYFTSQVKTNPPTLVLIVNKTKLFTETYERYLMNRFREELPFPEVPIRLILRSKRRAEEAARQRGAPAPTFEPTEAAHEQAAAGLDDETLLADLPGDAEAYFDE